VTVIDTPFGTSAIAVCAPVTAFGQWAIFPLGATEADGAGEPVEALAEGGGAAALEEADADAGVGADFSLQLSHAGNKTMAHSSSDWMRTGTSADVGLQGIVAAIHG
jgi:hypothetical protein